MNKPTLYTLIIISLVALVTIFLLLSNKPSDSNKNLGSDNDTQETLFGNVIITIKNQRYSRESIKVVLGTTVKWTNNDEMQHNIVSDSGNELGSELLSQEESYEHTFNTVGTFDYHCTPHPFMQGTVVVVAE
ncbi:cupredoxin domain-containing protein [Candidatus Dojkabacteria bacterium]|nr:cupredoxin domain-containing protein [Candidatus Dojkabacteria bacterium]